MQSVVIVVADSGVGHPVKPLSDVAAFPRDLQDFADLVVLATQDIVGSYPALVLPAANGVAARGTDQVGRTTIEVPVDLPPESLDALRMGYGPDETLEAAVYNRVAPLTGDDAAYDVEFRVP